MKNFDQQVVSKKNQHSEHYRWYHRKHDLGFKFHGFVLKYKPAIANPKTEFARITFSFFAAPSARHLCRIHWLRFFPAPAGRHRLMMTLLTELCSSFFFFYKYVVPTELLRKRVAVCRGATSDNSPAFQRRVRFVPRRVPEGWLKSSEPESAVPSELATLPHFTRQ